MKTARSPCGEKSNRFRARQIDTFVSPASIRGFPHRQMSDFSSSMGSMIDAIRVNAISRETRDGRALLIKRRRSWSPLAARTANAFFRAANHPVFVWEKLAQWQRWEVECFNLLHGGESRRAFAEGARTVCTDFLPGMILADYFVQRSFQPEMLDAAARELRRAHDLCSNLFDGAWSHGDANLANFLYDAGENRARLIDFETVHLRALSAEERHADDLLSFLQDLLGCACEAHWQAHAERFLVVYGQCAAVDRLRNQLVIPSGIPRVWWWIRTNYVSAETMRRRIAVLRELLTAKV